MTLEHAETRLNGCAGCLATCEDCVEIKEILDSLMYWASETHASEDTLDMEIERLTA